MMLRMREFASRPWRIDCSAYRENVSSHLYPVNGDQKNISNVVLHCDYFVVSVAWDLDVVRRVSCLCSREEMRKAALFVTGGLRVPAGVGHGSM